MVLCEVILAHFSESIFNEKGEIDPQGWPEWELYCRANGEALFEVKKPVDKNNIGVDQLPPSIRFSAVLTGNDLGKLGNVAQLPSEEEVMALGETDLIQEMKIRFQNDEESLVFHLHQYAQELLREGKVALAWKVLLQHG